MHLYLKKLFMTVMSKLLSPALSYLGYRDSRTESSLGENLRLPESFFYVNRNPLEDLIKIHHEFLRDSGWLESRNANRSLFNRELQPWIAFPAIHALGILDMKEMKIVEFGGGGSTAWFSKRAQSVTTFEFDSQWAKSLSNLFVGLSHVSIVQPDLQVGLLNLWSESKETNPPLGMYSDADIMHDPFVISVKKVLADADIILVDGGPRNLSMYLAGKFAKDNVIIVVDNADTAALSSGMESLREEGFVEIPFKGLSPLNHYQAVTSFFVRKIEALKTSS
jgi:hypothetical protein